MVENGRRRALGWWCAATLVIGGFSAAMASSPAVTDVAATGEPGSPASTSSTRPSRPQTMDREPVEGATTTAATAAGGPDDVSPAQAPNLDDDRGPIDHVPPPRPDPVPNVGEPGDDGWTGLTGVARFTDGSTHDICGVISDRAGTYTYLRTPPGVPFSVAFPPRPQVQVWVSGCDEGTHDPTHVAIETSMPVHSGRPTSVDWTVRRNEITVDVTVIDPFGAPVAGLCVVVDDQTHHTDAQGRVVTSSSWGAAAYVGFGWTCPDGGNWLGGISSYEHLQSAPEEVVRLRHVLPANDNDDFGSPWNGPYSSSLPFLTTSMQPDEPIPSCATGTPTGSMWFALSPERWSTGIRPNDEFPDGVFLAVWEGDAFGQLHEVACVAYPDPLPMGPVTEVLEGEAVHVQILNTGGPHVLDLHVRPR